MFSQWMILPGVRNHLLFAAAPFSTQAYVYGHDSAHVHKLVELELFKMFWGMIPDDTNLERLDELQTLLAIYDNLVCEYLHQFFH